MTESASNTLMATNFITDASGGVWGVIPSTTKGVQVCHNGVIDAGTGNVALLLYFNHGVYFENTYGTFYSYTSGAWKQVVDPRLPTETPSGTTVAVAGTVIYASNTSGAAPPALSKLDTWSFNSSGQVVHNGVVDAKTMNVVSLVYINHTVWQNTPADGPPWLWWYWTSEVAGVGGGWTLATTTPFPTVPTIPTVPTPTVPTPVPSIVHYGTFPPLTLPMTSGAVSPLGWSGVFFDDFTSLSNNPGNATCTTGAMYNGKLAVYQTNPGGGGNLQAMSNPANLTQSGSVLHLNLTATPYNGYSYSGAGIYSVNFLNATYGYWECRTKMPVGANGSANGLWGTWWVSNATGWPQEMDIIEQNVSAGPNHGGMNSTLHYSSGNKTSGGTFEGMQLPNGGDPTTDFHVYGGLCTPNYIAFYCDGVLMKSNGPNGYAVAINGQNGFSGINPSTANYFGNDPMCFIIQLEVGSGESGTSITAGTVPCSQDVDWVRYSALGPA